VPSKEVDDALQAINRAHEAKRLVEAVRDERDWMAARWTRIQGIASVISVAVSVLALAVAVLALVLTSQR
jgi:cell division protein FtsX